MSGIPSTATPGRYFDWAATAHPRSPHLEEVLRSYLEHGGTSSRSGVGRSIDITRKVERLRGRLADFFGITEPEYLVFTSGTTFGLNLALNNLCFPGARVLISPLEHNAVMRTLTALKSDESCKPKPEVRTMPAGHDGRIIVEELADEVDKGCDLMVINHLSNVNGVIQPLNEIIDLVESRSDESGNPINIPIVVDAAQSAGKVPLPIPGKTVKFVALSGHKGLMGLPGTGLLLLADDVVPRPLLYGGTGSRSESLQQPGFLPDAFEAGTPNIPGILGWSAVLDYQESADGKAWPAKASHLIQYLIESLKDIEGVKVYCADEPGRSVQNADIPDGCIAIEQGPLISFEISGREPGDTCLELWRDFGIETRHGLHCAPSAHQWLGTLNSGGTVRLSIGPWHSREDMAYVAGAIRKIANRS